MGTKLVLDQREVELVKTEALMVLGVQRPSKIAVELNCAVPTAASYIKAVQARWRQQDTVDFTRMRIELIQKSREVEFALWETHSKTKNENIKLGSLNSIMELQKFQAWLAGVTKVMDSK